MNDTILTEIRGRVLIITLNRPDARNALDSILTQGLLAAYERLDADDDLATGVLAGNGAGFCSGVDLKAFATSGPPKGVDRLFRGRVRKPVIAAVEGFALAGGLELALTADLSSPPTARSSGSQRSRSGCSPPAADSPLAPRHPATAGHGTCPHR
jgi:enoyl-CoA hydratase